MLKKTISLVINTKNEEGNITACLESARTLVDEIIVADMQSEDRTRDLAKKGGANVFKVKDFEYVEPARNFAISKATKEWVLVLDADQRLTPSLIRAIRNVVDGNQFDIVRIPRKNIIFGKWIRHAGWWPDYTTQLFRKKSFLGWPKTIHGLPKLKGRKISLAPSESNAIVHYNIQNLDQFLDRFKIYTKKEDSVKKHDLSKFDRAVSYFENEFVGRYFHQEGYKEGWRGFVLSKLMEYYRFIELVREWEKAGYKDEYSKEEIFKVMEKRMRDRRELSLIKSSKFYKLWRTYCNIRDKVFPSN